MRRYLSPEPLLQSPGYVAVMAGSGLSVPTYAYAMNNPLRYADPSGLGSVFASGSSYFQGLVYSYLASPQGAAVAATIAAAPQDVYVTEGTLTPAGSAIPFLGQTLPNDAMSTPSAIKVTLDPGAIISYNHGGFPSYLPTRFHPLSEFIAHEFGHVERILRELMAGAAKTRGWWKFIEPKTRADACRAGRAGGPDTMSAQRTAGG